MLCWQSGRMCLIIRLLTGDVTSTCLSYDTKVPARRRFLRWRKPPFCRSSTRSTSTRSSMVQMMRPDDSLILYDAQARLSQCGPSNQRKASPSPPLACDSAGYPKLAQSYSIPHATLQVSLVNIHAWRYPQDLGCFLHSAAPQLGRSRY